MFEYRWPRDEPETRGYRHHLRSWWNQRHNPDVLLLCYEDMLADLPGAVQIIAGFMGASVDDELLENVVRQSSRGFILAHKDQFNEQHIWEISGSRSGAATGWTRMRTFAGRSGSPDFFRSPASWRGQSGGYFREAQFKAARWVQRVLQASCRRFHLRRQFEDAVHGKPLDKAHGRQLFPTPVPLQAHIEVGQRFTQPQVD
ncbi:MAG: sulfotransferase domain-containing protein [Anaerolineales bacterium]|nr:sulfotransferase domain-containing protein [Anaerolineales bacterium]